VVALFAFFFGLQGQCQRAEHSNAGRNPGDGGTAGANGTKNARNARQTCGRR